MPKDVIMPALGMAQETGRVLKWLKAQGEQVLQNEMLLEIETDKVTVELEAQASGVLLDVSAAPGDDVPVGTVIARIWQQEELNTAVPLTATLPHTETLNSEAPVASGGSPAAHTVPSANVSTESVGVQSPPAPPSGGAHQQGFPTRRLMVPASPKARRLASERGVDVSRVWESEPGSEVVASNVLDRADSTSGSVEDKPEASNVWRVMAQRTAEAWKTIPHFYLAREVNSSKLVEWRQQLRGRFAQEITFTDLLVKKAATCLKFHPHLNSEWRSGVERHQEINIGVAMAVDQGLVVSVIHKADTLTVAEIAARRFQLATRARSGKLAPSDISGGTFTISNLGMYGVDSFHAIVNQPQAAILAVGRIAERLVAVDHQAAVRPMMTLTLSCDHRLVDGARAAKYLGDLAQALEQASLGEV